MGCHGELSQIEQFLIFKSTLQMQNHDMCFFFRIYIYTYVDGIGKSMHAFAVFFVETLQLFAPMPVRMKMPDADRDGRPRTSFAKARAQTHQRRICQQP